MKSQFEWIVVGAGPAGIATVGHLLDSGVESQNIAWIDPAFGVGDFGSLWRLVISNTPVDAFLKFFRDCRSFEFDARPTPFDIEKIPLQETCLLALVAAPLKWITERLKLQVHTVVDRTTRLTRGSDVWQLTLASGKSLCGRKVVLAVGAEPKQLQFNDLDEVPLKIALDPLLLGRSVKTSDHVAVFGDAQSARSVLGNLRRLGVKSVSHFYHTKNSVVRHLTDVDLTGIRSILSTPANLLATIPHCNKVIYAVGFKRRLIQIDGLPADFGYDPETGIIAPGIFGIGIAFPEVLHHEMGRAEYRLVAIWPIIKHLQRCLPLWLADSGLEPEINEPIRVSRVRNSQPALADLAPANPAD